MEVDDLAKGDRRRFLATMAIGLIAVAGCGEDQKPTGSAQPAGAGKPSSPSPSPSPRPTLPPIPSPRPGKAQVISSASGTPWDPTTPTQRIALTVDDGYDEATVGAYAEFAARTGIPITFNPNGVYQNIWNKYAPKLAPLIEKGQVQIGNHTFSHQDIVGRSDSAIKADIEQNEEWLQKTFKITSRPYFRPPFGSRNEHTDGVAAEIGFTKILMWDGTFGDSNLLTPDGLMNNARQWMKPGRIVLGHANHPTITHLYDQIQQLIAERKLEPVTLDTMFGTSRATG